MPTPASPTSFLRRLPRWLKVTILSVLVAANLVVLGIVWALQQGEEILATADTNREVSKVLDVASGESLTFLIVGSDSREGLEDLTNFGAIGGERGDVIMLVQVDRKTSSAQMLSIPRDLYVDIPGKGKNKINAAYALGGPSLMVETIRSALGVEVNHYVEVDFVGFAAVIDELGGVEIAFPFPARDLLSGLDVDAGSQVLDGDMALAYARSRKYQELRGGEWVYVNANDIGRTQRQQEVVRAIAKQVTSPLSIADAGATVTALARYVTIDAVLAESNVAGVAWDFRGILGGSVEGATLPSVTRTVDGLSVQIMSEPDAMIMLANFREGVQLAQAPIRIQVLNGNGISGSAAAMSRTLESQGFRVEAIGDADTKDYEKTVIIVPDGSSSGDRIITALGFGVVRPGEVDNGYDAVVIVGQDAA